MKLQVLVLSTGFLGQLLPSLADDAPPKAPIHEVENESWGEKITDPYRWLENVEHDPDAQKWLKAQAEFTTKTLDSLPAYMIWKSNRPATSRRLGS